MSTLRSIKRSIRHHKTSLLLSLLLLPFVLVLWFIVIYLLSALTPGR